MMRDLGLQDAADYLASVPPALFLPSPTPSLISCQFVLPSLLPPPKPWILALYLVLGDKGQGQVSGVSASFNDRKKRSVQDESGHKRRGWGVQVQGRRRLWGARLARRARPALAATARAFCRACAKYVYLIGSARKWRILLYMFYFRKYC